MNSRELIMAVMEFCERCQSISIPSVEIKATPRKARLIALYGVA